VYECEDRVSWDAPVAVCDELLIVRLTRWAKTTKNVMPRLVVQLGFEFFFDFSSSDLIHHRRVENQLTEECVT
jgi:hypothetical protein